MLADLLSRIQIHTGQASYSWFPASYLLFLPTIITGLVHKKSVVVVSGLLCFHSICSLSPSVSPSVRQSRVVALFHLLALSPRCLIMNSDVSPTPLSVFCGPLFLRLFSTFSRSFGLLGHSEGDGKGRPLRPSPSVRPPSCPLPRLQSPASHARAPRTLSY